MAEKVPVPGIRHKGRELIRSADGTTKDILTVVLEPEKEYSTDDAKKLVDRFLGKRVE